MGGMGNTKVVLFKEWVGWGIRRFYFLKDGGIRRL